MAMEGFRNDEWSGSSCQAIRGHVVWVVAGRLRTSRYFCAWPCVLNSVDGSSSQGPTDRP